MVAIAVSADTFESVRQESIEAGCDDFIAKPVRTDNLLECIGRHLELEWIYEKSKEKKPEVKAPPLIAPPEKELLNLLNLAKTGSITSIHKSVERIKKLDGKFLPFVVRIDNFAENFEFEKIQNFVKSFLKGKK